MHTFQYQGLNGVTAKSINVNFDAILVTYFFGLEIFSRWFHRVLLHELHSMMLWVSLR